jgi:hypothetical protein
MHRHLPAARRLADSFNDFHAKIVEQPGAVLSLYKDGALSVDAELFDTRYIQKLTVGQHKTYSVESCSTEGQQLPPITGPAHGGSLSVHVACKLPGKRSLRKLGFHLDDVKVVKLDNGRAPSGTRRTQSAPRDCASGETEERKSHFESEIRVVATSRAR